MDPALQAKAELRRQMRAILRGLSPERVAADSAAVMQRVLALPEVQAAVSVFCYLSMPTEEIATHALIARLIQGGRTVAVPRLVEGELEAHRITSLDDCTPGLYGILAPREPRPLELSPDVTLTPGLAFTPAGARLGRGKGFYDRFLARHPATTAIALAFEEQVLDALPAGPGDRAVSLIVTPARVVRCG